MAIVGPFSADSGILAGSGGNRVYDRKWLAKIDFTVGDVLDRDLIARRVGGHAITAEGGDGFHAITHAPAMTGHVIEQAAADLQAVLLRGTEPPPLAQRGCLGRPGGGPSSGNRP